VVSVEGTQGADRLVEGTGSELSVVLQVDQKIKNLGLTDAVDGAVGILGDELSNPIKVDILRTIS